MIFFKFGLTSAFDIGITGDIYNDIAYKEISIENVMTPPFDGYLPNLTCFLFIFSFRSKQLSVNLNSKHNAMDM